jgi:5-methylcytosine-specific restriction endonuclease McrA
MIPKSISSTQLVIAKFQTRINVYNKTIEDNLTDLLADKKLKGTKRLYVKELVRVSDKLITSTPSELKKLRAAFDVIISANTMKAKANKAFRGKILSALGYSLRRSDFYPKYFQELGIKACVYCNSQLTVSIDSTHKTNPIRKKVDAKFQVDHFLPKSHYPCLSVSLFNLVPVCASCNNSKSTSEVNFPFYVDNVTNPSSFKFSIDLKSKATYLLTRNNQDIKLSFHEPKVIAPIKSFKDVFDIPGIYDTQKDVVEELILKAEVYTPEYKSNLVKAFPKIFTDTKISNRLIIGNYSEEEEIHKRPMAKFIQDIAKDLGLL